MKIKDIVNRDIVNLTNCEREPIHIPGSIQPHGFLLGLSTVDFIIEFCSGNTNEYVGINYPDLLQKKFSEAFGIANNTALEAYLKKGLHGATPLALTLAGKPFLCTIHHNGACYVFEAEEAISIEKKKSIFTTKPLSF